MEVKIPLPKSGYPLRQITIETPVGTINSSCDDSHDEFCFVLPEGIEYDDCRVLVCNLNHGATPVTEPEVVKDRVKKPEPKKETKPKPESKKESKPESKKEPEPKPAPEMKEENLKFEDFGPKTSEDKKSKPNGESK